MAPFLTGAAPNVFFAQGAGIPISDEMLGALRRVQPEREGIDKYAIFGRQANGRADGRAGSWLEMSGTDAGEFSRLLEGGHSDAVRR